MTGWSKSKASSIQSEFTNTFQMPSSARYVIPLEVYINDDTILSRVSIGFSCTPGKETRRHLIVLPTKIALGLHIIQTNPVVISNPIWKMK